MNGVVLLRIGLNNFKMKKFKTVIFIINLLSLLDLAVNPTKGFLLLLTTDFLVRAIAILLIANLILLSLSETKLSIRGLSIKQLSLSYLSLSVILLNELLFKFNFYRMIDFIILLCLTIAIPFVLSNIMKRIRLVSLILVALTTITTFSYYRFMYKPTDTYLLGYNSLFVHNWVRNWIVFSGIVISTAFLINLKFFTKVNPVK